MSFLIASPLFYKKSYSSQAIEESKTGVRKGAITLISHMASQGSTMFWVSNSASLLYKFSFLPDRKLSAYNKLGRVLVVCSWVATKFLS